MNFDLMLVKWLVVVGVIMEIVIIIFLDFFLFSNKTNIFCQEKSIMSDAVEIATLVFVIFIFCIVLFWTIFVLVKKQFVVPDKNTFKTSD